MPVTVDKLVSLIAFSVVTIATVAVVHSLGAPGLGLAAGVMISFFGLGLIWFAEPLGEIGCFSRGIALQSPPALIKAFGWLFVVGYPALLVYVMESSQISG